jgi:hypothetical protein
LTREKNGGESLQGTVEKLIADNATDLEWRLENVEKLLAKAAEAERKRTRESARP